MQVIRLFRVAGAQRDLEHFASTWVSSFALVLIFAHFVTGIGSVWIIALSSCLQRSLWGRRFGPTVRSCELRTFILLFVLFCPLVTSLSSISSSQFLLLLEVLISTIEVMLESRDAIWYPKSSNGGILFPGSSSAAILFQCRRPILSILSAGACLLFRGKVLLEFITLVLLYDTFSLWELLLRFLDEDFRERVLIEVNTSLMNWRNAEEEAIREYFHSGRRVDGQMFYLLSCLVLCIWKRVSPESFAHASSNYRYLPHRDRVDVVKTNTSTILKFWGLRHEVCMMESGLTVRCLPAGDKITIPKINGTVKSSEVSSAHLDYGWSRKISIDAAVLALTILARRVSGKYSCWALVVRYEECNRMQFDMVLDTPISLAVMDGLQKGGAFVDGRSLMLFSVRGSHLYEAKRAGNMVHVASQSMDRSVHYCRGPALLLRNDIYLGNADCDVTDIVLNGGIGSRWNVVFEKLCKLDNVRICRPASQFIISTLAESVFKWKYGIVSADNIDEANDGTWRTLFSALSQNERRMLRSPYAFVRVTNTSALETTPTHAVLKKYQKKVVTRVGMSRLFHVERELELVIGTAGELTIDSDTDLVEYLGSQKLAGWVNARLAFEEQVRAKGSASCYFRSVDSQEEYCADLGINTDDLLTAGWHLEEWEEKGLIRAVDHKKNCSHVVKPQEGLMHITQERMPDYPEAEWKVLRFDSRIIGSSFPDCGGSTIAD